MSARTIFLSHTSLMARVPEGRSFVQAAKDAALRAGLSASDMQFFPADDRPPADVCQDAVRACGIYVGIFGHDYGSHVRERPDVSYTELEFLTALEERQKRGLRLFVFLLRDDVRLPDQDKPDADQAAFRSRVLNDHGLTAKFFEDARSLELEVYHTLREALVPAAPSDRRLQHLPYLPANFVGRSADLDEAERLIRSTLASGAALSLVGFRGMGGIGKTALAAALADRLAADVRLFPGGVLWANLLERAPEDVAREWVRDLGGEATGLTPEQCLTRFHELAAARRPLVVLDNVPRARGGDGPAAKLMVRGRGVATLVTTRFREAVPAGVCVREVEALSPDEATALLRTHVGEAVEADPRSAGTVLEKCGRLPLFVNVAGRAVANGYYSLTEYADELGQRGLLALADEDERAAVVFDLSWRHLSALAQEVFAALALAPGEDIGPNLLAAWLKQSGTAEASRARPGRLLGELANASLLIPTDEQARRYRYHDRVRDYALGKLALPREEARRRLLGCYSDWDMVRAEFDAVGAFALAGQYHRLRGWNAEEPKDFGPWYHFVRGQASVLGSHPELFFQQALNEPVDSPVSRAAQQRVGTAEAPGRWLEWLNRPREFVPPACLQVFIGTRGAVSSVALSADGCTAVSGSWDQMVRVWDLTRGRCRASLTGHTGWVRSVALSADGRTALSGADDKTVRIWDLATGQCRASLSGHTGQVRSVALSADGRTAVSGALDKTVRVWDLATGQCRATLTGHTGDVWSVALSADGRTAVSGADDKTVRVWDLAGGRCRATLTGHTGGVWSVALSADGRTAVSGALDKTVRVWDLASGQCRATLTGHTGRVWSVALSADGRIAVSGAATHAVRVWDLTGGQCRAILTGHTGDVWSVALSADGRTAVSGAHDQTVRVWDLAGGQCGVTLTGHTDWVYEVAVSADGRTAVSRAHDDTVRVWDLPDGQCRAVYPKDSPEARSAWEPVRVAGSLTAQCGGLLGGVFLEVRATGGEVVARFPGGFTVAAASPDGCHVVAGNPNGQVYLFRLHSRDD